MVGFANTPQDKEKPTGPYAHFVDYQYLVRIFYANTMAMRKIYHTDNMHVHLLPYIVGLETPLSSKAAIIRDEPGMVKNDAINAIAALGVGEEYLEAIIKDLKEKDDIDKFLRVKELESKGYTKS